jgi:N-acyl-D-aspartate/D-glutamate deacylase
MKQQVAEAMEQGAVGLSTGLNYGAGKFADTAELIELCRVVAKYNGVYATHVRGQGDTYKEAIAEALEIGEKSGVPVELSHMCPFPPHMGKSAEFMEPVTQARLRGLDVTIDTIMGDGVASLTDMLPPWTAEGGIQEQLKRLADPNLRDRIKRELRGEVEWTRNGPALLSRAGLFEQFGVFDAKEKSIVGKSWAELARIQNRDPLDVILDYLVDEGAPRGTIERIMDLDDLKYLVTLPYQMFASDTTPLPMEAKGPLGDTASTPAEYGSYPWFIRNFVREDNVLTLEEIIRKMTSFPAQRFQIWDRGLIKPGFKADIVVFDPDMISDRGTWENPRQAPVGIEYVLVNGQVVLNKGEHTGARPGKVLRFGL